MNEFYKCQRYIGDVDYSSVPFTIPADTTSYELKNCGFVVVPQAALDADAEKNSLTISITSWEGEHLGVFFGHCADIATSTYRYLLLHVFFLSLFYFARLLYQYQNQSIRSQFSSSIPTTSKR